MYFRGKDYKYEIHTFEFASQSCYLPPPPLLISTTSTTSPLEREWPELTSKLLISDMWYNSNHMPNCWEFLGDCDLSTSPVWLSLKEGKACLGGFANVYNFCLRFGKWTLICGTCLTTGAQRCFLRHHRSFCLWVNFMSVGFQAEKRRCGCLVVIPRGPCCYFVAEC